MVIGALPFSLVMVLIGIALIKAIWLDKRREKHGVQTVSDDPQDRQRWPGHRHRDRQAPIADAIAHAGALPAGNARLQRGCRASYSIVSRPACGQYRDRRQRFPERPIETLLRGHKTRKRS